MNPLHLFKSKRKIVFNIHRSIGVVCQLHVVVVSVFCICSPQSLVPFQALRLPKLVKFQFCAWLAEKLHLHLLKLLHPHDELSRHNLVPKRFSCLGDTKRQLHPSGFLHVQKVDKNPLGGFRTQIQTVFAGIRCAHLGAVHQVKLTYIGPISGATHRTNNPFRFNQFLDHGEVARLQTFLHHRIDAINLGLIFHHPRVGCAIHRRIKSLTKSLGSFVYFLVDFLSDFLLMILKQHIGAITLFAVFVVDHGITKPIHVTAGLPNLGVHKDGRINPNDVLIELGHGFPPILTQIVAQFNAVLAVIVNSG